MTSKAAAAFGATSLKSQRRECLLQRHHDRSFHNSLSRCERTDIRRTTSKGSPRSPHHVAKDPRAFPGADPEAKGPSFSNSLIRQYDPYSKLPQVRNIEKTDSTLSVKHDSTRRNQYWGEYDAEESLLQDPDKEDLVTTTSIPQRPSSDSTITNAERDTFARIFDDIIRSYEGPASPSQPSSSHSRQETDSIEHLEGEERLDSIFASAIKATSRDPFDDVPVSEPEVGGIEEFIQEAIRRYPPELRKAATSALYAERRQRIQAATEADETSTELEQLTAEQERKERHQEATKRVEGMLRAAETDVQVWNVLEEEVFSRMKDLKMDKVAVSKNDKIRKSNKAKSMQKKNPLEPPRFDDITVSEKTAALADLGPSYPYYLLLALRIFHYDFPSSPLALALLPAIKKYGYISYVLGATTAFYNELIHILYLTYGDFAGIVELLHEMKRGGIDFDNGTLDLLKEIERETSDVVRGGKGEGLELVYNMVAVGDAIKALSRWKPLVRRALLQKEQDEEARRREVEEEKKVGFEDPEEGIVIQNGV
ncbi:MAG: hypothetical protein M1827_000017 [Pycnora praestabilis]|nr:MAG: hypothetical protein M1827_000017 [Pycnora praestabilis]